MGWGGGWRDKENRYIIWCKLCNCLIKYLFLSILFPFLLFLPWFIMNTDNTTIEKLLLYIIWLRRAMMLYSFKQPRIGKRYKRIVWFWICYKKKQHQIEKELIKRWWQYTGFEVDALLWRRKILCSRTHIAVGGTKLTPCIWNLLII